ncbi:MAG: oligopeptide transporter, OPT family [Neisseriaceae bacterium]
MDQQVREFTIRGLLLGFLITCVFMAANIYLGLKVGLTVASSIPAAVISISLLRHFKDNSILENNLVQTQASSAGTLSSIIYVLPGLLLVGYWNRFDYWSTFLLCVAGGLLGVLFTIPLRRVLVVESQLPYPEGLAAAEILKAGEKNSNAKDAAFITSGGILAAIVSFFTGGLKLLSESASYWFKFNHSIFQLPFGFSLALVGAGYLVGLEVATVMLIGTFFNWTVMLPILSALNPMELTSHTSISEYGMELWQTRIRMMGVGAIGVGAIWTLVSLMGPVLQSVKVTFRQLTSQKVTLSHLQHEDIEFKYIFILFMIAIVMLVGAFYRIIDPIGLSWLWLAGLTAVVVALSVVLGFLVSATCGYMAGVLGTSSSPISSVAILAILVVAGTLTLVWKLGLQQEAPDLKNFLIALSILATSVVISVAGIANDNLQDLKAGQIVGASPAKQEWVLIVGCIGGALVLAPVLNMLFLAYGFQGMPLKAGMDPSAQLAAPQASLISVLAQGAFFHQIDWLDLGIGAAMGLTVVLLDTLARKLSAGKISFSPLAFGMGIYLPPYINVPIFFGAVLSSLVRRRFKEKALCDQAHQRGMLFASGLIVGESILGILIAMAILVSSYFGGSTTPFALHWWGGKTAQTVGFIVFFLALVYFYRRVIRSVRSS